MAILIWQGSEAAYGVNRFNFNDPNNWRSVLWTGVELYYLSTLTGPGPLDQLYIGRLLNGAGLTALSPCLFGGFSGSVAGGSWPGTNTSTTGSTFNSGIVSLHAELQGSLYPFPYFGGGLTGETYSYCINALGHNSQELSEPSSANKDKLTLKVKNWATIATTGRVDSNYELGGFNDKHGYPNYSVVNLHFVQDREAVWRPSVSTSLSLISAGISGLSSQGSGDVVITNGGFKSMNFWNNNQTTELPPFSTHQGSTAAISQSMQKALPPRALNATLIGVTASSIVTDNCALTIDQTCNIGTLTVRNSANPSFYTPSQRVQIAGSADEQLLNESVGNNETLPPQIVLQGTYDSVLANNYLGLTTGSTSSAFASGVFLEAQYALVTGNPRYDYTPRIQVERYDSAIDSTISAVNFRTKNDIPASISPYAAYGLKAKPWIVEFNGNANITNMVTENTTIRANKLTPPNKYLNIATLTLAEQSTLDMPFAPNFNNWFFGAASGSGASAQVIGGVNFSDKTSRVYGDVGVRFYNTKVSNNFDNRSQSQILYTPVLGELEGSGGGGFGGR